MEHISVKYRHLLPSHNGGQIRSMTETPSNSPSTSLPAWLNFFLSAGIPHSAASSYSNTFSQHRIRIDMLRDITKEILCDMGIRAMGDIIAILRHAKDICTQDELSSGMMLASASLKTPVSTPIKLPQRVPTSVKDRVTLKKPVTPPKSSPATNPTIGVKIQSRVNLNSGAVLAASSKRPTSSSISESLAKRLRPAHSDVGQSPIREKTLVVHRPSNDAIAKARQRISGNPLDEGGSNSRPIKSRLGMKSDDRPKRKISDRETFESNRDEPKGNFKNGWRSKRSRKNRSSKTSDIDTFKRLIKTQNSNANRDSKNRHKPTVFSRLGDSR